MPDDERDTVLLFSKSMTLNEIAEEATTFEAGLGPVIAIGRTADDSAVTFKLARHPDGDLKIALVKPPAATEVCKGKLWSANARVDAVAYRMPAG